MKDTGPKEHLDVPNVRAMMNSREIVFRSELLNYIIKVKRPFFPEEIEGKYERSVFESLSQKGLVAFREDGAIVGVYPVSALPTRHKVQLGDGRFFYAMCAIDSIGIAYELGEDLLITSSCTKCNMPITIEIQNGEVSQLTPSTAYASHVSIEKYKDWAESC